MKAEGNKTPLKISDLIAYGALAIPLAFAGLPFYIHAPDFYTRVHGVSLSVMGSILLSVRLVDAVQDPFIGRMGDRFARQRVTIILVALALLGLGFGLLYNPPTAVSQALWFAGTMIVSAFAFSTIAINLNALGSLWTKDSEQKTRVTTVREGLGLIGLLLATLLPTLLQLRWTPERSFEVYAGFFLVVIIVTGFAFYRWGSAQRAITHDAQPARGLSYARLIALVRRPSASFFAAYGLSMLASSIPGVLVLQFIRDRLHAEKLTGLFLIIYFVAGVIGMPFWRKLSVRIGKEQSWLVAMCVAFTSFVWAFFLQEGDLVAYGLICFISGTALGAELVLPPSIASDFIDREAVEAETSSVFAIMHFLSKLALAVASGAAFLLLDRLGYRPGANGQGPTGSGLYAMSIVYALIPCIIKFISALVLALSLLSRKPHHA